MEKSVTLVILPGLDGTEVFFRPFLNSLPAYVRAVVVEYPGSGDNDYETLLQFARESVADVPEFFLLGSSFSGPLAIMLAAEEPERVQGIILSATFLRPPREYQTYLRFACVGPVIWALRFARRFPVWVGRKAGDPFREAKAETWRRVSAWHLAARARAVLRVDVRETWRRCAQPALSISFTEDTVVPPHNAREIAQYRPGIKSVAIPGDHLTVSKNHRPWAKEILQFMDETLAKTPRA
jgi:pimeloyl-ACP methyl ester carboxylesterase